MGLFCVTTLLVEIRHFTWQLIDRAIRNTRPELDKRGQDQVCSASGSLAYERCSVGAKVSKQSQTTGKEVTMRTFDSCHVTQSWLLV